MCKENTIEKWTKDCVFPFAKIGDFGITKNYTNVTLTAIAAKAYKTQFLYHIRPEVEKIILKNQNGF